MFCCLWCWNFLFLLVTFFCCTRMFCCLWCWNFLFLKKFILPRLKIWVRETEEHDNGERISKGLQEATEAAKVAATAAADMRETILAMLKYKNEEKWYIEALVKHLDVQVAEIKSMSNAIWKLGGARDALLTSRKHAQHVSTTNVRPSSAPASMRTSVPQHPKPLKEEISGSHTNHTQPLQNHQLTPKTKPWEVAEAQNNVCNDYEGSKMQASEVVSQMNGDNSVPWWRNTVINTKFESEKVKWLL